ncbi:MAG TPA: DUF5615 family PIN-like protein [Candidatus Acidoferrales bacterium]|nr:DUF5615 family PIN-like protein [Candidatus Acidoferrales bacterium]
MTRRFYKHKLLLDEGFPPRWYFPHVNQRFDVKHIKSDLQKTGLSDEKVYTVAVEMKRIIITYNVKDFKRLAKNSENTGVIGVSSLMPYYQIDNQLTSLLTKSNKKALHGKFTALNEAT